MRHLTRPALISLYFLLVLATGCSFQSGLSSYDTTILPLDSAVKVGKLDNGLSYYIRENKKPEHKAELRLVVNTGSIEEDDDQLGLAHFTEHMAFNGTRDFKKNELVSYLQSIGVDFGADLNAYTGYEETVYLLSIPMQNPQNLDTGFRVLENWAGYLAFDGDEIDKERAVVLEELRAGRGANERMWKKLQPKLLMQSKYASRDPIGEEKILNTFSHDTIKRFYRDWYRPDLMAVVAVGDFAAADIEKIIRERFSSLQNPAKPRPLERPAVQKRNSAEAIVITDKEATDSSVMVLYPIQDDLSLRAVGDYRQYAIESLAHSMINERLVELAKSPNPPFSQAGMDDATIVRNTVFPYLASDVVQPGVETAFSANVREVNRVYRHGFTTAELDNAKKIFAKNIDSALLEKDTTDSVNYVDEYIQHFLRQEAAPGITNEHRYFMRYLSGITLDDVNDYIKNHIASPDHYLAVFMGPEKPSFPMPTEAQLLSYVDKVAKENISAYEYKKLPDTLMAEKPVPGKVVTRRDVAQPQLTELTLSNGVKVILKPTTFRSDEVILRAFRKGGQYLYPDSDHYSALYASTLVNEMGLADFSPTDLGRILAGKHANVYANLENVGESVNGYASNTDIEQMLQLLHMYMTSPRKDEQLFKSYMSQAKNQADYSLSDPETYFYNERIRFLYGNHQRRPRNLMRGELDKVDLDRAFAIYQQRFMDASDFTFVIVGTFTIENIIPLIEMYVASLPASGTTQHFGDVGLRPLQGVHKKNVYKGQDPKSNISIVFTGPASYSRYDKLTLRALTDILNIRIMESLRENMGVIYSGGVYGSISKEPYQRYYINLDLPCGPESVDKAIAAFWAEVKLVKQKGPTDEDLIKFKETLIQQHLVNMENNNYWVDRLEGVYEDGEDPAVLNQTRERIQAITQADVQKAAQYYLNEQNYVQVVLYPESGR